MSTLHLFSPASAVPRVEALRRAERRLRALGFEVQRDASVLARSQGFAGDDATRLAALHRVADAAPDIAMATRGGYGLTRLLDGIDWPRLARSVEGGTRWVGFSDLTALQLGLFAHTGAATWAGPMAVSDFGRPDDEGGVDETTRDVFLEAMDDRLHALGFKTESGFDGLERRGTLWGGNLTVLMSLLGTPHWPQVPGGILFLEDVGEQPYRIERMLLQLHQSGVLASQIALLLGTFTETQAPVDDRGACLRRAVATLRAVTTTPVLTGLPFGHVQPKLTLPVGRPVDLVVQRRDVFIGW